MKGDIYDPTKYIHMYMYMYVFLSSVNVNMHIYISMTIRGKTNKSVPASIHPSKWICMNCTIRKLECSLVIRMISPNLTVN